MTDMNDVNDETVDTSLNNPDVVTKYRTAGDIANRVLVNVIQAAVPNATVLSLCQLGDKQILDETSKIFKGKTIKKGIAFPTCISVNHCVCHCSPLTSDEPITLKDGDVVKIDLGVHIDGFAAMAAHTIVIGSSTAKPATGRKADALMAAHVASEAALRLVQPGNKSSDVTAAVQKIAESYKCLPIEGMLSHQLEQNIVDGAKTIIQNPTENQKKDLKDNTFEVNEVYAVDVLVSTGEGKPRVLDTRTTVYKKTEAVYLLKMKASRAFLSEVQNTFGTMPFTLRALEDEKKARMGVVECANHSLVSPFHVLYEKEDAFVAQFKFTVLLTANGPLRITHGPAVDAKSDLAVTDESLKALLAQSVNRKTLKKKSKAKAMETDSDAKAMASA